MHRIYLIIIITHGLAVFNKGVTYIGGRLLCLLECDGGTNGSENDSKASR